MRFSSAELSQDDARRGLLSLPAPLMDLRHKFVEPAKFAHACDHASVLNIRVAPAGIAENAFQILAGCLSAETAGHVFAVPDAREALLSCLDFGAR
jgi:hypothetical protein